MGRRDTLVKNARTSAGHNLLAAKSYHDLKMCHRQGSPDTGMDERNLLPVMIDIVYPVVTGLP